MSWVLEEQQEQRQVRLLRAQGWKLLLLLLVQERVSSLPQGQEQRRGEQESPWRARWRQQPWE